MRLQTCFLGAIALSAAARAQTSATLTDASLINLQTPTLLGANKAGASIDLRYAGGYDKTFLTNAWLGYGIGKGLELDFSGSFEKWSSTGGGFVRFGGTDEQLSLLYKLPMSFPVTLQGSLAYTQTPSQFDRVVSSVGISTGYSLTSKVRLYMNPRAVFLDRNSLVGIGLGGVGDIYPKVSLMADWTPVVIGENTVNVQTGRFSRSQLYSAGIRYTDDGGGGVVDLGLTNASGITTGSSLTPTLGSSPSFFVRFGYRF